MTPMDRLRRIVAMLLISAMSFAAIWHSPASHAMAGNDVDRSHAHGAMPMQLADSSSAKQFEVRSGHIMASFIDDDPAPSRTTDATLSKCGQCALSCGAVSLLPPIHLKSSSPKLSFGFRRPSPSAFRTVPTDRLERPPKVG